MKKAQISVEFLMILGVIFFIFLLLMVFYLDIRIDLKKLESTASARSDCFKLADLIYQTASSGEGSLVQAKIDRNITVQNQTIFIGYDKTDLICKHLGKIASDVAVNGSIILRNVNNTVLIQNA